MIHSICKLSDLPKNSRPGKRVFSRTAVSYIDIDNRHLLFRLSKHQFNVPAVSVKAVTISSEPD